MKTIVTFSPHIVEGKPRGYYLIMPYLFPNGTPILRRDQFAGFDGRGLIVTLSRHNAWNTLKHMAIQIPKLATWLGTCRLYVQKHGVRIYLPSSVLKPTPAEEKRELRAELLKESFGAGVADLWYVRIPGVDADVLLGRKKL